MSNSLETKDSLGPESPIAACKQDLVEGKRDDMHQSNKNVGKEVWHYRPSHMKGFVFGSRQ